MLPGTLKTLVGPVFVRGCHRLLLRRGRRRGRPVVVVCDVGAGMRPLGAVIGNVEVVGGAATAPAPTPTGTREDEKIDSCLCFSRVFFC